MEVFTMSFLLFSSGSVGNPARPSSASVCHIIGITESLKTYTLMCLGILFLYTRRRRQHQTLFSMSAFNALHLPSFIHNR